MESRIATALRLKYHPVALLWADEAPEQARQFQEGKRGCVMYLLAHAAKGGSAVLDWAHIGCGGGAVGLGFGNQFEDFPGGVDCYYYYLSIGNDRWVHGRVIAKEIKEFGLSDFYEDFTRGEACKKTPDLAQRFVDNLPMMELSKNCVVLKPLEQVDMASETPVSVTFLAKPDQLAALVTLASYGRAGAENITMPAAAACHALGIYTYREAQSPRPRAVVGLSDLTARKYLRKVIDPDCFSFSAPWSLFLEMEDNVADSFLERAVWRALTSEGNSGSR